MSRKELPAETLDLVVFTTGIFAAPKRQETAEGIERDMAISYLSRLVHPARASPRVSEGPAGGSDEAARVRHGLPGYRASRHARRPQCREVLQRAWAVHMNTVAGNEMLVLDSAKRYPNASFFGLNPGLIKTNIRDNFLGEGTLKSRVIEWLIGLLAPSAETYAENLTPLLVSPDLEGHSGAMFDRKGRQSCLRPS